MTRLPWILAAVLGVELVVAGVLIVRRVQTPTPPLPRVELFDNQTAAALRAERDAVPSRSPRDWAKLAERYIAHGFYAEAEACHRRACELAPDDARLRGLWAFCLSRMGRMARAIELFEEALKLGHARPAELHYFIGRDHLRLEEVAAARAAFKAAGDLPAARYERAKLALAENRVDEAVELLAPLQQEHADVLPVHWLRARAEQQRGDLAAADRFAQRAAAVNGRLPTPFDDHSDRVYDAHNYFGLSQRWHDARELIENERFEDAREVLEAGLASQWHSQGADLLADVAFRQGRQAECIELLKDILENDETTLHRLWRYGDALQEAGRTDQAYPTWRHAIALGPETDGKGLYVKLFQYHSDRGEQTQADRFKARYYHASGVELLRGDDPVKARASLEESVRLYDEDPDAWFYLGETRQRLNDGPAARDAYERCLALRPEHGRARRAMGQFGPAKKRDAD